MFCIFLLFLMIYETQTKKIILRFSLFLFRTRNGMDLVFNMDTSHLIYLPN